MSTTANTPIDRVAAWLWGGPRPSLEWPQSRRDALARQREDERRRSVIYPAEPPPCGLARTLVAAVLQTIWLVGVVVTFVAVTAWEAATARVSGEGRGE